MAGQKVFYYPDRGPLRFEYVTFQANDDPALKLAGGRGSPGQAGRWYAG